jgi:hypothetical protein
MGRLQPALGHLKVAPTKCVTFDAALAVAKDHVDVVRNATIVR